MPLNSQQLAQIPAVQAAANASAPDFKALVCVFLNGGNDAHNTVIPLGSGYVGYAAGRGPLSIAENTILPLNGTSLAGLHPNMTGMQALWNAGDMAIVTNIGPLVETMTKAEYGSDYIPGSNKLRPLGLQSHADQQLAWNSGLPGTAGPLTGWGGRLHDLIEQTYNSTAIAPSTITIAGRTRFQEGNSVNQYQIGTDGPTQLATQDNFSGPGRTSGFAIPAMTAVYGQTYTHPMEKEIARIANRGIQFAAVVNNAGNSVALTTTFPSTSIGRQLRRAAITIASRTTLGLRRQLLFCQMGGYDTHSNSLADHGSLMTQLSSAIKAFNDAMIELGVNNQVTLFTQSDFGRTLFPNGSGTDHGWGGHAFVIGGAVNGGAFYNKATPTSAPTNTFPDVSIDGPYDGGQGRLVPTTSADEYSATLAKWYGLPDVARSVVIPNIAAFSHPNLGFLT